MMVLTNHASRLVIVDCLQSSESGAARRLREDVEPLLVACQRPLALELVRTPTKKDFILLLRDLCVRARSHEDYPILHIEAHGSEEGIQFADGSFIVWPELKPLLIEINCASRLNLLVVLAACSGAYLAKTLDPTDRAPVFGLLGPTERAKTRDLSGTLTNFYAILMQSLEGDDALRAVKTSENRLANYGFIGALIFSGKCTEPISKRKPRKSDIASAHPG